LSGAAATTEQAYFDENFAAGKTQGEIGLAAALWLQTPTALADADFKSYAESFTATVATGVTYSQNSANTTPSISASANTFVLTASTTNPDDFTGTSTNDTFTASAGRLQDNDAINGAAGTDTLNATLAASAAYYSTDVEVHNLNVIANATVNGARINGATDVNVTGGAVLTYSAQDGEAFSVAGDSTGLTVTRSATDTTTDAITVSLKDGKVGTVSLGDAGNGADYEVFNLVVAGAGSATITEADADNDQTDDGWA
jgi:hypothetical protein